LQYYILGSGGLQIGIAVGPSGQYLAEPSSSLLLT